MIIHMRHTLWTGISETNVNVITSATRTHAFNKIISQILALNIIMLIVARNKNIVSIFNIHESARFAQLERFLQHRI